MMDRRHTKFIRLVGAALVIVLAGAAACSGPESNSPLDLTPTPSEAVAESEPTETSTETEPTAEPTATESPTAEPSPTASPTPEPTATPTVEPTPTQPPVALSEALPAAEHLPGAGFALANEGPRSALDLANAYADPPEHLDRLDDWGFDEHYFREFSRESSGGDDPLPSFVLTTGNQYGSVGQAEDALDWLRQLNSSQGHEFVEPPEFGDNAIASTLATVEGEPTAIVFVRIEARIFAAFASGGDPLPFVLEVGEVIAERAGWQPQNGDDATEDDELDEEDQDGAGPTEEADD